MQRPEATLNEKRTWEAPRITGLNAKVADATDAGTVSGFTEGATFRTAPFSIYDPGFTFIYYS